MKTIIAINQGLFGIGSIRWGIYKAGRYQGFCVTQPKSNEKDAIKEYYISKASDF